MTLSVNRAARLMVFVLALAYTGLTFGVAVTPASAQSSAYYVAELAAPASETSAVAGGVAWTCRENLCVANKGNSRPMRICRGLAREFGEVVSFRTQGEELAADRLAKCNGK